MTDRELLQQALLAIENAYVNSGIATAIRARLAQPEQEDTLQRQIETLTKNNDILQKANYMAFKNGRRVLETLIAMREAQKPLSDEEIKRIEETTTCVAGESWLRNLCRNIEAAHNIK